MSWFKSEKPTRSATKYKSCWTLAVCARGFITTYVPGKNNPPNVHPANHTQGLTKLLTKSFLLAGFGFAASMLAAAQKEIHRNARRRFIKRYPMGFTLLC